MSDTAGASPVGFEQRGLKGWAWTIEQYLEEIPVLADLGMTFLMNCYISLCDLDRWGQPGSNRWWEPLPDDLRAGFERVVRACHNAGLEFWFSMNPNLFATRFASVDDPDGLDALWRHYAWMQGLGVRWFSVALDDVGQGIDPAGQAALPTSCCVACEPATRRSRWSSAQRSSGATPPTRPMPPISGRCPGPSTSGSGSSGPAMAS